MYTKPGSFFSRTVDIEPAFPDNNIPEKEPEKAEEMPTKKVEKKQQTKRTRSPSSPLQPVNQKRSLNIKISPGLDDQLKLARSKARERGLRWSVSADVEAYLSKRVEKVLLELETDEHQTEFEL